MKLTPPRVNAPTRSVNPSPVGHVQSPLGQPKVAHSASGIVPSRTAPERGKASRLHASLSSGQPGPSQPDRQALKDRLNKLRLALPPAVTVLEDTPELVQARSEIAEAVKALLNLQENSVMPVARYACKTGDTKRLEALCTLIRHGVIDPNEGVPDEFDPLREALIKAYDPPEGVIRSSEEKAPLVPSRLSVHERIGKLTKAGFDIDLRTSTMQTLLHIAAEEQSRPEVLRALIAHGVSVDSLNNLRQTPLHKVLWQPDCDETASILLDHGANVGVRDKLDRTPLEIAASAASPAVIQAVIDKLKEQGGDINDADSIGRTPLHHAARLSDREEAIAVLLRNGANPLAQDIEGNTPRYLYSSENGKPWPL